ncbi:DUF3667 domain-containing protein [Pedobacter mucosus]|uniref:DUF3667 domain-containing protein n=1 Tax=Pedobacter mucosus TaxID=2895286 RepID=UPI001EE4C8FD|nr:DUF3667 domain-containing protein [Pedobacter mucosus]UKT65664.1 DUF3667 domain-containing protein [Pedobacter mucosus]
MSAGKYRKEHDCLNCGSQVETHYCSNCGQPNLELKESFWGFISHSIGHYFHFDNKFFSTLTPLLTQPGKVTLDYLAGKRARYINPVSMYIFVSIVYFIIVPKASIKTDQEEGVKIEQSKPVHISSKLITDSVNKELTKQGISNGFINDAISTVNNQLSLKEFRKRSFKEQEKIINDLKIKAANSKDESVDEILEDYQTANLIKQDSTYASYLARQKLLAPADQDNWYKRMLKKRDIVINQKTSSGWTLKEEMEHYRPKQYFLLMPLLALFIMLNFRRNHIFYLDHLIFTIHGMTAYFIVEIATRPFLKYIFGYDSILGDIIEIAVLAWIVWYLFKALRIFYNRSVKATIWKMLWLLLLYASAFYITEKIVSETIYYVLA